jgi:transposase
MADDLYWLTNVQMERLSAFFPKSRGRARVDDRRVLSGIVFVNRNGLRWRDAPAAYGPPRPSTTVGSAGAAWASSLGC